MVERHRGRATHTAIRGTTQITSTSTFASTEAMERVVAIGAEEGAVLAIDRIDELLAG